MDKGPFSERKTPPSDALRPMIVPIPESSGPQPSAITACPDVFERLLANALQNRATDILIERDDARVSVRQRIRGVLISDLRVNMTPAEALALMDFVRTAGQTQAEAELQWSELVLNREVDKRLLMIRFVLSEATAFRLLSIHLSSLDTKPLDPANWGMGPHQAQLLMNFLGKSHGLIIFCGLEDDGVSDSLHACTKFLSTPERHVIAVGNVAEAWPPSVRQLISHNDSEAYTNHLKMVFRHKPDAVVVSTVDSKEAFDLCLRQAIKGRLVLVRVTAGDSADALMQVLSMGVEPYLLSAGLLGAVAQRQLRLNCQTCQDKDNVPRERLKELGIPVGMQPAAFFHGKGCDRCFKTGFDRETNIFEVLEMADDLRPRLTRDIKAEALRSYLKSNGLMTLRQMAIHKAINGQTSLAEVLRVTA